MENMVNYGIDLGTTNSAITKFIKGEVAVFSNPTDFGRNTLPSVVGYKKDKILVGSKAKELLEKDPRNVVGTFKRKMGTSESYKIKAINDSKTPIDLSTTVLKELKTFLPPGEVLDAAVITIPASFDTIQSNATKEAGIQAGFKQVILLQEPIAASLAYANMKKEKDLQDGQWLVYDFGGGTFDVALIRIKEGEMKVLDHEGDNFLGGADFDRLIVERILVPKLEEKYSFDDLATSLKSATGRLNAQYYVMLRHAEEAKIMLSAKTSADITVEGFEDENGELVDEEIIITRSELNDLIRPYIDGTTDMIKKILTRNSLMPSDVQFTLMVGGSTYIPYVRKRVEEVLQIGVICDIDPTTAVAIGAAYYAATKPKEVREVSKEKIQSRISIKAAYEKVSKEREEIFSARVTGSLDDLFYRIMREDGGFDTGLKTLTERINEDLPLVEGVYNFFKLSIYDRHNNIIETDLGLIGINSGYGISGQPLPEDICLEIDDEDLYGATKLLLVFQKNAVLPLRRTITRQLNKAVVRGSEDNIIRVNVLEGPHTALPEANKPIGYLTLTGRQLTRDVHKGSDIEILVQLSESRDLTISVYLMMADQEFTETFNPKVRHTPIGKLRLDIDTLSEKLEEEIEEATEQENYEVAKELTSLRKEMEVVAEQIGTVADDDVTDARYQLEDKKRKLAQAIDFATKDKRISTARIRYAEIREKCSAIISEGGNDQEQKHFNDIVAQEPSFLNSQNLIKIQEKIDELSAIQGQILWRLPKFLTGTFSYLCNEVPKMNNPEQARSLVDAGRFSVESQNWERLREVNISLINLLPRSRNQDISTIIGF
ncbi:Hsp70 family protein [Fibrivirga algicola]|uniref:Hsp70 family protein n=1 Tax=Fibrivirga algicola TaxID=2950420 RepID=A0ABX0QRL3_9BACT|nr:Hsp70 family protein [Fibrivirga algicola]NID13517.1 Hsp70 family protein [Fibrivirga algicola]